MSYYAWMRAVQQCPHCAWRGFGESAVLLEAFEYLAEYGCPECGSKIANVAFPTTGEMRNEGGPSDRAAASVIEARGSERTVRALVAADQSPELTEQRAGPKEQQSAGVAMTDSVELTVEWGYELHSITLTPRNWRRIVAGKPLRLRGKGYRYEGEFFWDYWEFGGGVEGSLVVTYGEEGQAGFIGTVSDAIAGGADGDDDREGDDDDNIDRIPCPYCASEGCCPHLIATFAVTERSLHAGALSGADLDALLMASLSSAGPRRGPPGLEYEFDDLREVFDRSMEVTESPEEAYANCAQEVINLLMAALERQPEVESHEYVVDEGSGTWAYRDFWASAADGAIQRLLGDLRALAAPPSSGTPWIG